LLGTDDGAAAHFANETFLTDSVESTGMKEFTPAFLVRFWIHILAFPPHDFSPSPKVTFTTM
jgi:hypothetical protein